MKPPTERIKGPIQYEDVSAPLDMTPWKNKCHPEVSGTTVRIFHMKPPAERIKGPIQYEDVSAPLDMTFLFDS